MQLSVSWTFSSGVVFLFAIPPFWIRLSRSLLIDLDLGPPPHPSLQSPPYTTTTPHPSLNGRKSEVIYLEWCTLSQVLPSQTCSRLALS